MNSETIAMPVFFARRFLERQGAVVEASLVGFDALLPQELAERLELPDYVRIKDGVPAESEGAYGINYGSPLLEKMVDLTCSPVPLASCHLSCHYLKSQRTAARPNTANITAINIANSMPFAKPMRLICQEPECFCSPQKALSARILKR